MENKLLNICIPTYNRGKYLRESLESIIAQFVDEEVLLKVDIIILDNISEDDTESVAREFSEKYQNIKYIKDAEKRDITQGIIKVASMASGKYIWIFSDDDIQAPGCLKKVITCLENEGSDLILCNIDGFIGKNEIYKKNLFNESDDKLFKDRASLFGYFNTKFFYTIDYFTTYCSNWILSKEFFDSNINVFEKYSTAKIDMFPFPSLVFYSGKEYSTKIISESIVFFRADNASWGHKNPIRHFLYQDKLWRRHYGLIVNYNNDIISNSFVLNVKIKNLLRVRDFIFLLFVLFLKKVKLFDFARNANKKIRNGKQYYE